MASRPKCASALVQPDGNYEYYVGCDNDECNVNPKTRMTNDVYGDKENAIQEAIKKWNSR